MDFGEGPAKILIAGRPGRNRTCNPRIRNPMLYPFELRAHIHATARRSRRFGRSGADPTFAVSRDRFNSGVTGSLLYGLSIAQPSRCG